MKNYLVGILALLLSSAVNAQKMRDVFASMPDSLLYIMTLNNRLDCIDFIENDMEAKVRNRFDGFSTLKVLTDDYLMLELTQSSSVEMKLLPGKDSLEYICMVTTFAAPAKDSKVALYDMSWNNLNAKHNVSHPDFTKFIENLNDNDADSVVNIKNTQGFVLYQASLSAKEPVIRWKVNIDNNDKKEADKFAKLTGELVYEWKDGNFLLKEEN